MKESVGTWRGKFSTFKSRSRANLRTPKTVELSCWRWAHEKPLVEWASVHVLVIITFSDSRMYMLIVQHVKVMPSPQIRGKYKLPTTLLLRENHFLRIETPRFGFFSRYAHVHISIFKTCYQIKYSANDFLSVRRFLHHELRGSIVFSLID